VVTTKTPPFKLEIVGNDKMTGLQPGSKVASRVLAGKMSCLETKIVEEIQHIITFNLIINLWRHIKR